MTSSDPGVAAGTTVYEHGRAPCSGIGLTWTGEEVDAALEGPVAAILFDDEGDRAIAGILGEPPDGGFASERVEELLKETADVEDWRVGEALGQAYLEDHRACFFPWPAGRDRRTASANLPGADLVGFGTHDGDCLVFGEVKTSGESRYPPRVVSGGSGLQAQLTALRDREALRNDLVRYLGHRAGAAPWLARFRAAALRYFENTTDVQLYGVLVRDAAPHPDDLRTCVQALATDRPPATRVELVALYLPVGRIDGVGRAVTAQRTGDDA